MFNLRKLLGRTPPSPPSTPQPPQFLDPRESVPLMAELLYDAPPSLSLQSLQSALAPLLPKSKVVAPGEQSLLVLHEDHPACINDAPRIPAQTAIFTPTTPPSREKLEAALAQTRDRPRHAPAPRQRTHVPPS